MHSKPMIFIPVVLAAMVLAACTSAASKTADPAETIQSFYQAMNDGDIEAAMPFVAEDIECSGHCHLMGKESFRAFIQGNIDHRDQFEISDLRASGNKVTFNYIIYRSEAVFARGVDSVMQIEEGMIVYFEIN